MVRDISQMITGESAAICDLRKRVSRIAPFDITVLLVGATGTGKERVAEAIHALSPRADGPLVSINCAALPDNLIEAELFGHERGAFSGAVSSAPGKFRLAEGGTLFLDEVGELSAAAQAKVLRVIENRVYYRVGGTKPEHVDTRLVVATHRDLELQCTNGLFRCDLFYRLNVARIDLPSLHERASDILALARHFLRDAAGQMSRPELNLSPEAQAALRGYPWPGNVRELRNAMEIASINAESDHITVADLPVSVLRWLGDLNQRPNEKDRLLDVLHKVHGNKSAAARRLGWSRMKLYRKLRAHGLCSEVVQP